MTNVHTEHEDHPWTVDIADHAARSDSPEYVASRALMNKLTKTMSDPPYGSGPAIQDHHGAGWWLKDSAGWFMVRGIFGVEWSAQFCCAPEKLDKLRLLARRLYAAFPGVAEELGIRSLLDTPITDAAGVATWTDSICNASVPLPAALHTGVAPAGHGSHHYPQPILDMEYFKRDDFVLWVSDAQGNPTAVVPVAPHGSGDGRVRVAYATPGSMLHQQHSIAEAAGEALVLEAEHPLAQQAFAKQV